MSGNPKPPSWARIPGKIEGLREKSVRYRLSAGQYSEVAFIPTSQLKDPPVVGAQDILVAAWLPQKNSWPVIPT